MPGLGTIANVAAIVAGGLLGCGAGKLFTEKMRDTLLAVCGVMVCFLGIGGTLSQMLVIRDGALSATGTMMMVFSLLLGTIAGSLLDIEKRVEQFGIWLRNRTGNEKDRAFVNAFVSASLTVCIGAMAVIGSIEDGVYGNHAVLFMKAILDFSIIVAMEAAMGAGTIFSAIPVGIVQGLITLLARLAAPYLSDAAMGNLSYVGDILITCVGINLLFPKKVNVANMLPSLVIAILWAYLF